MYYTWDPYVLCIMWAEYTRVLIWAVYARVVLEQPTERHARISGCGPPCLYPRLAFTFTNIYMQSHAHDV